MGGTLIIRFGALGDVCVTSWFVAGLSEQDVPRPIVVVTKAVHAPLAAAIPGVDQVLSLDNDGGPTEFWRLSRRVRRLAPDLWLDAHSVLRSRLLGLLGGRRVDARLRKNTLDRWRLILTGGVRSQAPALLDRLDRLYPGAPGRARLQPVVRPPLAHLRPPADHVPRVALAPGARWPTKRWPDTHAATLLRRLLALDDRQVSLLLGPDDADWLTLVGTTDLRDHPRLRVVAGAPLLDVAAELGRCRVAVTNDSGLLHLAEAVGTPVTALFGPTVRAFGYAPLLPTSRLLEVNLDCRPCSRTGARPCHRGDHACLVSLTPDTVLDAVNALLASGEETP